MKDVSCAHLFGQHNAIQMPRRANPCEYVEWLGVLIARSPFHDTVLGVDINQHFFALIFGEERGSAMDDITRLQNVHSRLADAIRVGAYDTAVMTYSDDTAIPLFEGIEHIQINDLKQRDDYMLRVILFTCGTPFRDKFSKSFLREGYLSSDFHNSND
jgi:hypothetical protein